MGERTEAQVNDAREVGLAILRRIHATEQAPVKVAAKAGIFHANEKLSGAEDFTARDVLRILEVEDASSERPQPRRRNALGSVDVGPAPQLLKVAEVAKRLGVSSDGVYTRIERGEIPVVELGDTRKNQRVRESDLTAFIDRNTYGRGTAGRRGCCVDDREEGLVNGTAPDESLTPAQQRRRAQALDEAGQVISEAIAIFAPLTPRQSAERVWAPGGPPVDELTARIEASRARLIYGFDDDERGGAVRQT